MNTKIKQSLTGGIIGTAVMTMVMFVAPMMGFPKMNPAAMLSMMTGLSITVGWIMHFMIGVIFAMMFSFFFIRVVRKACNNVMKGVFFGITVFIFAQIMMVSMKAMMGQPLMGDNLLFMMVGSLIGHVIYGIVVALFVKEVSG